ncbi:MAG: hypothetical protein M3P11_06495 [Actinomycetota bacterium]|nr:hypothetical protein [Actinomycetota bacterium]
MPLVPVRGSRVDIGSGEARERLAREARRLDAYNFWVLPVPADSTGDLIVTGVTGVFLLTACGLSGEPRLGRRPLIGDTPVPVRPLRLAAKQLGALLGRASVFSVVEPFVVLTDATFGAAMTVEGVRFVHLDDVLKEITARSRTLPVQRAQRAARALGMQLAGDQRRSFSIHRSG